ncbi:MAG TPA: tetratricopeptide repeat protein, partial [Candidatus Saccharimonadales bacterium]|nr:tetratricopeptide repeat protein [Candidatus Saccharimonadales bacterium]
MARVKPIPATVKHSPAQEGQAAFFGQEWFWACGLFVLTCLAYLPVMWSGGFVWDDNFMVGDNTMLRSARGLHDLWFTTRPADPFPITMTALWMQWHWFGGNPIGYHVVNVIAHACGALLLWRVLLSLTAARAPRLAWLAAAVFALHPVAVASAGWISEEKNTISGIFYWLAILYYLRFTKKGYGLALFFYGCALLSKGSVVMLPVALLILVWWRRERIARADLWPLVPFFVLSAASGLITIWFQNHKAIAGEMVQDLGVPARILAAMWAVCFYLWKALAPVNICVIYPAPSVAAEWIAAFVLAAIFFAAWFYRKTWGRNVLVALGCFVATLFPVMGFLNMYFLVFSRVADHWQYLALPAAIGLAVFGGGHWFERASVRFHFSKMAGPLLSAALLAGLFAGTWSRAEVYRNEKSLWTDTVAKNPKAWMAWNNLGNALGAEGQTDASIDCYEKALAVKADFPDAASNLGNALVAEGRLGEAVSYLQKAVKEEPRMAKFHFNYGVGLAAQGHWDAASAQYNA